MSSSRTDLLPMYVEDSERERAMPFIALFFVAIVVIWSWIFSAVQAIRIPTEAWDEIGQTKGIWVALTLWFPVLGGLLFQLVMKPKLIVAWRTFHEREVEGNKAA